MSSLETIKRSLRNYLPTSVNIDDFIKAEMTLALLEKCKPEGDPTKAYLHYEPRPPGSYGWRQMYIAGAWSKTKASLHSCSSKMNCKGSENYRNAQLSFVCIFLQRKLKRQQRA